MRRTRHCQPLPTYDLTPREAETLLAFSQTIDHATGFGDADLRRFPHAHALHDQAQMLSGKLARNVEEKGTKQGGSDRACAGRGCG